MKIKAEIQDIRYKEVHLALLPVNFELFEKIEEDFQLLFTLWDVVFKWETNRAIWYYKQFSEFEIDRPEIVISEMLGNLKKIDKSVRSIHSQELYGMMVQVKKEIDFLQDNHLRLLKLLKKEGFSRKHL